MIGTASVSAGALIRLGGIARTAGRQILSCCDAIDTAWQKSDASPVTAADLAAEHVIVEALSAWDPGIPILSEESPHPSPTERQRWERWWLIDPLDGTKEFLSGNGEYTVNIALLEEGEPVLGVVFAPALDVLYAAGRGLGAWRQVGSDRPQRVRSERWRSSRPARIVESRSHPSFELETYLRSIKVAERIRLGSSLKFCRVADGTADLYPRFGPVMEWDVAAGDCIYRNSSDDGQRSSPLTYNSADLRIPGFILGAEDTWRSA